MVKCEEIEVEGYERVIKISEPLSGLTAITAIHNTVLGPALGGVRVYPYSSFDEALTDVLRLAEGMTRKAAVAQSGTGGGKSVIIADGRKEKTPALLHAFGEAVNRLGGDYICAADVGMSVRDVAVIHEKTNYVVGLPETSGNPSYYTAWGTFRGIQAVAQMLFGSARLEGKKIALQGLGSVGLILANYLFWEGAELLVADLDQEAVARCVKLYGARSIPVEEICFVECDIFAPCALGGILNEKTIPQLRCQAVAGAANNQLLTPEDGERLYKRGILYAPDFVLNSGGLLNVCEEITPRGYNPMAARTSVDRIFTLLLEIFERAKKEGVATNSIADALADHNVAHGVGKRREKVVFHSKIS